MSQCTHPATEIRLRTLSNQTTVIHRQCLTCGESVGGAIKKASISPEELAALPPFDDALRAIYQESERKRYQEERAKQQAEWDAESPARKAEYAAYLQTPDWASKRKAVLEHDDWICQGCLEARATEVHHLTYAHRGDELLFELTSLCRECHQKCHASP